MANFYRSLLVLFSWCLLSPAVFSQPGERRPGAQPTNLYRVTRDSISRPSRVGFIDKTGRLVIGFDQLPGTTVSVGDFYEGRARICVSQADDHTNNCIVGFIDETGKVVIGPSFERARDFSEGLAYVEGKGQRGFINREGKLVIRVDQVTDDVIQASDFHEGRAATLAKNGKWGYIDRRGNLAIKPKYSFVSEFSEGLAGVVVDRLFGFIDQRGEMVIPPRFKPQRGQYTWDGIVGTSRFSEGLACVREGELFGYINKRGEFVIPPQFYNAQDFSEGLAWVVSADYKEIGWIDKLGRWAINAVNRHNLSPSQPGAYSRFTSFPMIFSEGLAPFAALVRPGYPGHYFRWGYMDHKGREIIKPRFAYIYPFDGGLAWVTSDEASGYIDKGGQFVWKK